MSYKLYVGIVSFERRMESILRQMAAISLANQQNTGFSYNVDISGHMQ